MEIGESSHRTTGKNKIVPSSDLDDSENESELVMEIDLEPANYNSNELDDEIVNDNHEHSIPEHKNAMENYNLINEMDMDSSSDELGQDGQEHDQPTCGRSETESDGENNETDTLAIDVDNL